MKNAILYITNNSIKNSHFFRMTLIIIHFEPCCDTEKLDWLIKFNWAQKLTVRGIYSEI